MSKTLLPHDRLPFRSLLLYGWMPGFLKIWIYRTFRGYRIGRGVKLGFGALVEGRRVDIGDHVSIGWLALVMGKDIRIGPHSSIGMMSYVSCPKIEIGEDARIREQVWVGGPELPESSFRLGSRTVILQRTSINPTKPVVIGDDTGIGGHCLIFTHSSWLSALEGYPVGYEPVTLGNSVWLPWRVFVLPGTTIGDGSVIGANALVLGTIPPRSLAVGSPAKVVKSAPDFPSVPNAAQRRAIVEEIVAEFVRFVEDEGIAVHEAAPFRLFTRDGATHRLLWLRQGGGEDAAGRGDTVLAETALSDAQREGLAGRAAHWLDLGRKTRSEDGGALTEELALFLGRYGVRLARERPKTSS